MSVMKPILTNGSARMKFIIGLYGQQRPGRKMADSLRIWREWILSRFGNPTHISGEFVIEPAKMKENKAYSFAKARSRFDEQLSGDNLTSLGLTSMASRPDGSIAFKWDWDAEFVYRDRSWTASLGCDLSSRRSDWLMLADECRRVVSECMGIEYGFVALMPEEHMPNGYVIGLAAGGFGKDGCWEDFIVDANAWRRFARDECGHSIRNAFGYHILNSRHLGIPVAGQRLEDWIKASDSRGRLEPLEGGLFAWTFQEGADQETFLHWNYPPVVRVREELKQHHVFPWQKLLDKPGRVHG